jgi:phosphate-selective porin OprO and OprP
MQLTSEPNAAKKRRTMNFYRKLFFPRLYLAVFVLAIPPASAQTQATKEGAPAAFSRQLEKSETKRKADDVEQLKSKIEKLEALVEQQQRALAAVLKRLDEVDDRARAITAGVSLDTRAASLEVHQVPNTAPAANQAKAQDKPVAGWDQDKGHAFLRSADGAFETTIGGYAQLDYHGYQSGNHPPNTFLIRRARLGVEGKLARYFDFKVEGDFSDPATPLRDFYVNIHRIDEFQLKFGQFRIPISQEELRGDAPQDFVERSMVNNLIPARSPGLMASGALNKGAFEYQIGAFNGKGLLAQNNNGTPETAIRLRFTPWKNRGDFMTRGFSFGGAFTQGRSLGGTSVRGLTESRSFTFFSPDAINGKYVRANGELTWLLGPLAIRAEYDQTNQRRDNLGTGGGNLPGVVAKGYTAQVTYLLTGEDKPDAASVAPKNNLFGDGSGKEGFGAWELKFRYANLQIADGTAKSNRAESFFFGPNWYMNRFVRYVLDLGFERFKDPARSPRPGDRNFFVVLSRVQVAF